MLASVGEEPSLPQRCGCQHHRSSVPGDTPSEYYCHISIPVLDHLLSEMESRFSSHQQTALLGLSIIPSILVTLSAEEYTTKSMQLAEMYMDDLPSPDCIQSELHCWQLKWQQHLRENGSASLPSTPTFTLRQVTLCQVTPMYPNIWVLITIMCILPVTSCSAERATSVFHDNRMTDRTDSPSHPSWHPCRRLQQLMNLLDAIPGGYSYLTFWLIQSCTEHIYHLSNVHPQSLLITIFYSYHNNDRLCIPLGKHKMRGVVNKGGVASKNFARTMRAFLFWYC